MLNTAVSSGVVITIVIYQVQNPAQTILLNMV